MNYHTAGASLGLLISLYHYLRWVLSFFVYRQNLRYFQLFQERILRFEFVIFAIAACRSWTQILRYQFDLVSLILFALLYLVSCIFILLSLESDQSAIRARLGVASHLRELRSVRARRFSSQQSLIILQKLHSLFLVIFFFFSFNNNPNKTYNESKT